MRNVGLFLLVLGMMLAAFGHRKEPLQQQASNSSSVSYFTEAEEAKGVEESVRQYVEAFLSNNIIPEMRLAVIETYWLNDQSVVVVENGNIDYGWDTYRDQHLLGELRLKDITYVIRDLVVRFDGQIAWLACSFDFGATTPQMKYVSRGVSIFKLIKHEGRWRIASMHQQARSQRVP